MNYFQNESEMINNLLYQKYNKNIISFCTNLWIYMCLAMFWNVIIALLEPGTTGMQDLQHTLVMSTVNN